MKNTPLKLLIFFCSLLVSSPTTVFAQDTVYVWQSADGDPYNIQATIVLDSPSSANGSASDVVSLFISDSVDTYSWNSAQGGLWLSPLESFSWDSAQILQMDIYTSDAPKSPYAAFEAGPGEIFDSTTQAGVSDQHGEWVAASTVPEPSPMVLVPFAAPLFVAARRNAASRQSALA